MHLSLTFPSSWDQKSAPGNRHVAILPGQGKPQAIITYGPITERPDEPRPFMEQTVRSDLPPGSKVKMGRAGDQETTAGWPFHVIESEVLTAKDELIECRLTVFFQLMEHFSVVVVRAGDRQSMDANGKAILDILQTARPDWRSGPSCLAEVWDLEPQPKAKPRAVQRTAPVRDETGLKEALAKADEALQSEPTAPKHIRRGGVLLDLDKPAEALEAFRAAIALDDKSVGGHYFAGVALGDLEQHAEAIAEFEKALALDPTLVDAHYNLAQARFWLKEFDAALAGFKKVVELDPADLLAQRKVIQCLYALGRYDEGLDARLAFRHAWSTAPDARARMLQEYVYDQFEGAGFRVHALETLRPRDPSIFAMFTFRAVDAHDAPLPATVLVETSDQAKAAGTPFVLGVTSGPQFRVVGAAKELPPYAELKKTVLELLGQALQKSN